MNEWEEVDEYPDDDDQDDEDEYDDEETEDGLTVDSIINAQTECLQKYKEETENVDDFESWLETGTIPQRLIDNANWAGTLEKKNGHVPSRFSTPLRLAPAPNIQELRRRIEMAESQSRYSIIDELIAKKNAADDEINKLETSISHKELELKRQQEDIDAYKEDVAKRKATLEGRKKNLDDAVKAIENISKEKKSEGT